MLDDVSRTEIYARNLPIELCMTSNVLCRTVKDYDEHHIRELLEQGHPFVLCVSYLKKMPDGLAKVVCWIIAIWNVD